MEKKGEPLFKKCFKKLERSNNQKVNFVCRYSVTKILFFTNMKVKLSKLSKSNMVYQFSCLVVNLPILEKLSEHSSKEQKNM